MQQCRVVLHSMQRHSPTRIASVDWWSEEWVCPVIMDFNRVGRNALFPQRVGTRPPIFIPSLRQRMIDVALRSPHD